MKSSLRGAESISRQALWLVGSTVIAQAIFAVVYLLAARGGTPAEFGAAAAAAALGTAAAGYIDFGSNALWVRESARGKLRPTTIASLVLSKNIVAATLAIAWIAATLTLFADTPLWVAGTSAFALVWSQTWQVPLRGAALIGRVSIAVIADRAVALAVLGGLLASGRSVAVAFGAALLIGPLVSGFVCFWLTPRTIRPNLAHYRFTVPWRGSAAYGLSSAAVGSQSLDMTILSAVSSTVATGSYAAVSRWTQPLGMLANAFASVSVPHVAAAPSWKSAIEHARKSLWLLGLGIAGSIALAFGAPILVEFLLGPEYGPSAAVLRVLALAMVPAIVNQPMATFLQARGRDRSVSVVVVCGVALHLALVALLGSNFGALGAAVAFLAMQSAILVALGFLMKRGASSMVEESGSV
ncbi:polysaccharide biosynthesis C-terminal domain-containing protein [Demequina sp. SYSU T00068]|uniref:polysaccharide biosynthesis C-terminal domain-containing protein n=1 Tax=Demequina lignilytica TaxID=3051663 RepID=UPI00261EA3EF|nr:polysaccharide biosynthesis C-terminal domain-containing protein [Demequina sp. SYSU T00068]MDN4490648.1 polysaccharide biosynthesis C-terminal domain-containing protein [Demequina sp. SYSU T00068]